MPLESKPVPTLNPPADVCAASGTVCWAGVIPKRSFTVLAYSVLVSSHVCSATTGLTGGDVLVPLPPPSTPLVETKTPLELLVPLPPVGELEPLPLPLSPGVLLSPPPMGPTA